MPSTELRDNYSATQVAEIERVARMLSGEIIHTGGGMHAVAFPRSNEAQPGQFLAGLDDNDVWAVTFEGDGDDGQREWVEINDVWRLADNEAEAFVIAGEQAAKGPLL